MSRKVSLSKVSLSCFPRVSGDEPQLDRAGFALTVFSPRERG